MFFVIYFDKLIFKKKYFKLLYKSLFLRNSKVNYGCQMKRLHQELEKEEDIKGSPKNIIEDKKSGECNCHII